MTLMSPREDGSSRRITNKVSRKFSSAVNTEDVIGIIIEQLFNLKFAAKELSRNSKRCDKEEKAEKLKIKKVTKSMAGVVKSMDSTLKSMNLEKISALMDKFERQFETLDVQTAHMEDTMSSTTTLTTPQNQVDTLMQELADEAGLDLNMELPQGQTGSVGTSVASAEQAIQKGNTEVARIHAENAIRQKNQSINFLRMSARVDAVAARVQTAVTMNKVTKSMAGVVKSMDSTLKSMNLEKISALMDKFERQFETLDVQTAHMEDTMSSTTTLTTPQNQVDTLMQELADEAGLDLNMELPQGQTGSVGTSVASAEQDELSQRLARLRDQV
ncbi:Charged multivesicular body protein 1b [Acipenser ruthenus]|uniref:Charged multivesicular body protein 1b n=1 Tax=Acipenser ruthenus TaxID=7906 RepID=A0A444V5W6_ACIRT|nr:Charged multivesicular body protein 1b [Acipenser ruthenus]